MEIKTNGPRFTITEVMPAEARFAAVLQLAASVLEQNRYLLADIGHAETSHIVAAWKADRCVGFLRFHTRQVGSDAGRPPVVHQGTPLREGYVDAFGVDPGWRRQGIGNDLQAFAVDHCRQSGCHQMRSRSPVTSTENYSLKIAAGYTLHPSDENDSYYFLLLL